MMYETAATGWNGWRSIGSAKYVAPDGPTRDVFTTPALEDVFDSLCGRSRYDVSFTAFIKLMEKGSANRHTCDVG